MSIGISSQDDSLPTEESWVARWFVFKPKIPIWTNLGGSCYVKSWYFILPLGYFTAIGNILWTFDIICGNLVYFSPFWFFGPRKIWQPR
jgi:hypothetical protein